MRHKKLLALGLAALLVVPAHAAELKTHEQKYSYAIGFRLAQSLQAEGLKVDATAFSAAMTDALSGKEPAMSVEDMQAALQAERDRQLEAFNKIAEANKAAGDKYRADNAKKDGVKSLPSGMQYRVLNAGSGKQASAESTVTVHYRGTLVNGKEFDSSYKRDNPAKFGLSGVIKGWQEIVPMMKVGDKWEVVLPPEFGYGESGAPGGVIGPNETLIFEIELLEVS